MSKKANPAVIGVFIVSGALLLVAGIVLFSSARLFAKSRKYILYFDNSLNGLSEGAAVKFRGVPIGTVNRMMIHYNQPTNDVFMPVIIELQDKLLRERLDNAGALDDPGRLEATIRRGLRARLQAESFLTGVLYVELAILSNAAPADFHQVKKVYPEIPTESTELQQLLNNLAQFDVKGLETKISQLITNVNAALVKLDTGGMIASVTNLLKSLNNFASSPELTNALVTIQSTMTEYQRLAEKLNSRIEPLADSATNTLAEASQTLVQLRTAVQNLNGMVAPDSRLHTDLAQALEQIMGAAQSLSSLADFLERHPNALITGRKKSDQKP
jgi:paraquat-inducible protein B